MHFKSHLESHVLHVKNMEKTPKLFSYSKFNFMLKEENSSTKKLLSLNNMALYLILVCMFS